MTLVLLYMVDTFQTSTCFYDLSISMVDTLQTSTHFYDLSVTMLDPSLLRRYNGAQHNEWIGSFSTAIIRQIITAYKKPKNKQFQHS